MHECFWKNLYWHWHWEMTCGFAGGTPCTAPGMASFLDYDFHGQFACLSRKKWHQKRLSSFVRYKLLDSRLLSLWHYPRGFQDHAPLQEHGEQATQGAIVALRLPGCKLRQPIFARLVALSHHAMWTGQSLIHIADRLYCLSSRSTFLSCTKELDGTCGYCS